MFNCQNLTPFDKESFKCRLALMKDRESEISFEQCDFSRLSIDDLIEVFQSLPATIKHINLSNLTNLNLSHTDLIRLIQALPVTLQTLNLSNNDLGTHYQGAGELAAIFQAFPNALTAIDLSNNKLDLCAPNDELPMALTALHQSIEKLDISGNGLFGLADDQFQFMISCLSPHLKELVFANNNAQGRTSDNKLTLLLRVSPPSLNSLDVSRNQISHIDPFIQLPSHIEHLNLSHNDFRYMYLTEEMPKLRQTRLKSLDVSMSRFLLRSNWGVGADTILEDFESLLSALPSTLHTIDIHTGTEGLRNLLPYLSESQLEQLSKTIYETYGLSTFITNQEGLSERAKAAFHSASPDKAIQAFKEVAAEKLPLPPELVEVISGHVRDFDKDFRQVQESRGVLAHYEFLNKIGELRHCIGRKIEADKLPEVQALLGDLEGLIETHIPKLTHNQEGNDLTLHYAIAATRAVRENDPRQRNYLLNLRQHAQRLERSDKMKTAGLILLCIAAILTATAIVIGTLGIGLPFVIGAASLATVSLAGSGASFFMKSREDNKMHRSHQQRIVLNQEALEREEATQSSTEESDEDLSADSSVQMQ